MIIPRKFEYVDTINLFDTNREVHKYVTILDAFNHHYTGDRFYYIRVEFLNHIIKGYPMVEYNTVSEKKLAQMLDKRMEE